MTTKKQRKEIRRYARIKKTKNKQRSISKIEIANMIVTAFFSLMLVVVGIAQFFTYQKQADIAENANVLAKYNYRFEYYNKLKAMEGSLQYFIVDSWEEIPIIEESIFNEIVSLQNEAALLFDEDTSQLIINTLESHRFFLIDIRDMDKIEFENYYTDSSNDYSRTLSALLLEYTKLLYSDNIMKYLNINAIK